MAQNFLKPITACFGQPVAENPTQVMIEAAFRQLGLDWRYITLEVGPDDLAAGVAGARAMGFRGFNCTIPHKVAVIEHLDGLGESAAVMQAVNCVVRRGDQLIGENTDGKGFVEGVKKLRDPKGKTVVLLGAGGAARAIAVELALAGASKITLVNRTPARGAATKALLDDQLEVATELVTWDAPYAIPEGADFLINATSVGLYPDVDAKLNLQYDTLDAATFVSDVVFNPPATHLIREAKARGCETLDGLEMLVGQGVIGVEYWTGSTPDPQVMRESLEAVFTES
ncbi:MAG: shikimate dehydrogenase [Verrucomicrobiales bacterium]|jgi:shikimate dehydrogenase